MRGKKLTLGLLAGLLAAAVVVPSRLAARVKEAPGEYAGRRARLIEQVGNPVVLFGYSGNEEISPAETFRQEENFYYLTGHEEPGAALLLIPQTEEAKAAGLPAEILFLPPRDKPREHWEGIKLGPGDPKISELTGFAVVKPVADLRGELERALRIFPHLYTLFPEPGPDSEATHAGQWLAWLKAALPESGFRDVRGTLGAMRQVKSKSEQKLLRVAIEHSIEAHRAALGAVRPGLYEYEVAALMEYTFKRAGCERPGYAPIVGSGFNSTVLHYDASRRQLGAGDLVVIDAAAECAGYTADITRTLPVSGTFTPRQREVYEIVLGAQNAVLAAVKPGMSFARTGENSLYLIAYNYINTHGKDSHGEPLGKYFIHGLGHHIGLQVHDAGDPYRPLEPGMIVTIEPGIYIPEENLGVRIEDIVLITEHGAVLLTSSLPRTVGEVETAMLAQSRNDCSTRLAPPTYPPLARIAHIEGEVRAVAEIGRDGHVVDAIATEGHPLLSEAVVQNLRTWVVGCVDRAASFPIRQEVTFEFHIRGEPAANLTAPTVRFDLPGRVEVYAQPVKTSDPTGR